MDCRSAGRAVGDLLHLWRKHGLWRGLARQAERGQRGGVLRPCLLRARGDLAGGIGPCRRARLLRAGRVGEGTMDQHEQKELVRARYGGIAEAASAASCCAPAASCCGPTADPDSKSREMGYSDAEL